MENDLQQIIEEMRDVAQRDEPMVAASLLDRWADELQRILDEED